MVATTQQKRIQYKQTEVGMIPEEWEAIAIGDVAKFTSGAPINVTTLHVRSADYRVPVFGGNGIAGYTRNALIGGPSVIVGRVGQKCGTVYLSEGPVWITDNALYPERLRRPLDMGFLALALEHVGLNEVRNHNDLPLVTQSILHAVRIPWPPDTVEQRAIATAVSDVDTLIGSLDELIAKKRDMKTGATQQLLSGKQRLPGFRGKWGTIRLGECGSTYGGLSGKTKGDFGVGTARYIPFLNVMNNVVINSKGFEQVRVSEAERQNEVRNGDLFFNGSSETPEEVGMCAVLLDDVRYVFLNSFCFGFRFREGAAADGLYLAYFFRSSKGRELVYSLAQGATRYNLSKTNLMKVEFALPGLEEQVAIASVLADMDAEIAALQGRRDKTHALKQGMMQQLLTGKIRLI